MDKTGPSGLGSLTGCRRGSCENTTRESGCGRRHCGRSAQPFYSGQNRAQSLEDREKNLLEELQAIKEEKESLTK